jgi:hypothetical protein
LTPQVPQPSALQTANETKKVETTENPKINSEEK